MENLPRDAAQAINERLRESSSPLRFHDIAPGVHLRWFEAEAVNKALRALRCNLRVQRCRGPGCINGGTRRIFFRQSGQWLYLCPDCTEARRNVCLFDSDE